MKKAPSSFALMFSLMFAFSILAPRLSKACDDFNFGGSVDVNCSSNGQNSTFQLFIDVFYYDQEDRVVLFNLCGNGQVLEAEVDCQSGFFSFTHEGEDGKQVSGYGVLGNNGDVDLFWGVSQNGNVSTYSSTYTPGSTFTSAPDQREGKYIAIGPNPMSDIAFLHLHTPDLKGLRIELIDAQGRIVRRIDRVRGPVVRLERGSLEAGLYFYRLFRDTKALESGRLIVR